MLEAASSLRGCPAANLSTVRPGIDASFNKALFLRPDIQKFLSAYTVESFEKGLLFFNREL